MRAVCARHQKIICDCDLCACSRCAAARPIRQPSWSSGKFSHWPSLTRMHATLSCMLASGAGAGRPNNVDACAHTARNESLFGWQRTRARCADSTHSEPGQDSPKISGSSNPRFRISGFIKSPSAPTRPSAACQIEPHPAAEAMRLLISWSPRRRAGKADDAREAG